MLKSVLRRPSPALAVAFIALLVALGGTSLAAFSLPRNSVGTKQLQNGAVTASKLKHGAVTASKLNISGLTVPNAEHANSADSAGSAITASSAGNAANAGNAGQLGGVAASGYTRSDCDSHTGQLKGWAIVNGAATFSSSFVPVTGYNCAGGFGSTGEVLAERLGVGLYEVEFPNNADTMIVGSVSPNGFIDQTEIRPGQFLIGVQNETGSKIDSTFDVMSP